MKSTPLSSTAPKHDLQSDVLVVGGGIAGLACAYYLAQAGVDTILIEAASAFGSHATAQNAAILRTLIQDPWLTAIGRHSANHLHHPPKGFASGPLVDRVGLLLTAGPEAAGDFADWLEAAGPAPYAECQAELVDAATAARLAPFVQHPDHASFEGGKTAAVWLPSEGHIDIAALTQGFVKGARRPGPSGRAARLLLNAPLESLCLDSTGITGAVLSGGQRIKTQRVLCTGGAWAGELARKAGSPLCFTPQRRHLVVTIPQHPGTVDPRWPIVWNHGESPGQSFYARPESSGLLISACDETKLEPSFPPEVGRCPRDSAALEAVAHTAARFLPDFATAGVQSWWAGWRTFGHSSTFAIGPDPAVPGIFWAAGLGGHGMTSAFEVGRLAAKAISDSSASVLDGPDYRGAFLPTAPVTCKT